MPVKVIVTIAVSQNNVIGVNGKLPWHSPSDLARFKEATDGRVLIMGRKTWDSLPAQKLPGRLCNVVTSLPINTETDDSFIGVFKDVTFAVDILTGLLQRNQHLPQEIHLIGGAQLLEEAFKQDLVDEVRLTRILDQYTGDTYFKNEWLANFIFAEESYLPTVDGEPMQRLEIYRRKFN